MRQKKLKYVDEAFLKDRDVKTDITPVALPRNRRIALEIGSGKGRFITDIAEDDPDSLYIALEVNMNVCYRIVQKRDDKDLKNLIIILGDAKHLLEYFAERTIDHIYLNFSDPWPKKRHHKRRLTAPSFLNVYRRILKRSGTLSLRTDHRDFFEDSLIELHGVFRITNVDYDLKKGAYMTEYEEKKRAVGPIYQVDAEVI
ncbi:MAG: tRNA (guanosine(46)-N7)-methyltransferase TrmB [Acholeplasmataceae bacterium]